VVPSDRTRGNSHELKKMKVHLNTKTHFYTVKVVKHWHRLPREVVESPCLEISKTQLNTRKKYRRGEKETRSHKKHKEIPSKEALNCTV